jgi:hypothetical protein
VLSRTGGERDGARRGEQWASAENVLPVSGLDVRIPWNYFRAPKRWLGGQSSLNAALGRVGEKLLPQWQV